MNEDTTEVVEKQPIDDTVPQEQPVTEPEVTEQDSETTEQPEAEQKGASQRIRELSQRAKAAEETAKSLEDRIKELTRANDGDIKPYTPEVNAGEEITPERYQQDLTKTADSIVQIRLRQLRAEDRINLEATQAMTDYPQLNPKSKEFDQELSETITEAVEAHIRVNPYNATVKKFVDRLMKPYAKAIEKEVGEARANIAKQVTQTALRPTSVKKTEKTAQEKSIAELEAELGMVNS